MWILSEASEGIWPAPCLPAQSDGRRVGYWREVTAKPAGRKDEARNLPQAAAGKPSDPLKAGMSAAGAKGASGRVQCAA